MKKVTYESDIGRKLVKTIKRNWPDAYVLKTTWRHWPDYLVLIKTQVWLIELKTPKGRVSPGQEAKRVELVANGNFVLITNSVEEAIEWIQSTKKQ